MTYVTAKDFKGVVNFKHKLGDFSDKMWEVMNQHITDWLREVQVDVHLYKGNLRVVLDVHLYEGPDHVRGSGDEIIFEMPFAEFFQELNEEPPEMEEFLLAGLKYYRETYEIEPGEEYPDDE